VNSQLIQQVRVLDPVANTDRIADVLIKDRMIETIAPNLSEDINADTEVIDGQGLILGPGLVDLYSHSGEPGFEERETLASLMQAASVGGFTRLAILPDTLPPVDNPSGLAGVHASLKKLPKKSPENLPRLLIWGALTMGANGEQMTELAELANAGVVGFADGQPVKKLGLLRRTLEYVQPLQRPIALWPCDRDLSGNGSVREGNTSIRLGLVGAPAMAETSPLAAILEIVAAIKTPVHLMRISTARSVELIRAAKAEGLPITASTTWMHLLLNVEDISGVSGQNDQCVPAPLVPYDSSLHLDPPLGNPDDQLALIGAIQDGTIDAVAIDHSPYTYEETHVAFAESPPGAIGLELALPLLWQNLVQTGKLTPLQLWRVLSSNPAQCFQQKPATVTSGSPAELTLFDPEKTWDVEIGDLVSKSHNTPWLGHSLTGKVVKTFQP
jgi:dihydroorotase